MRATLKSVIPTLVLSVAMGVTGAAENVAPVASEPAYHPSPKSVAAASSFNTGALTSSGEDASAEATLLDSINRSRAEAGVTALAMDDSLRQAARLHAERMVTARSLEHQFPGEPALLPRIADVSTLPLDRAGENIANVTCVSDAHNLLMNSPPHRQNILDPQFNVAGIAAIWSHGRLYVVQDFARAMPRYSVSQADKLVSEAVDEARQNGGLAGLTAKTPAQLNDAACSLAAEDHPNARLIAASYPDRKIITYTQSRPEILPRGALRLLADPDLRQFAVGSCYARNATYPAGIYWVAILLY
jgi:uncharacterized protein YkwD